MSTAILHPAVGYADHGAKHNRRIRWGSNTVRSGQLAICCLNRGRPYLFSLLDAADC
jgi:hypothetical protein